MPRTRKQSAEQRLVLARNRFRQLTEADPLRGTQNRTIHRRNYNSSWRSNRRQDPVYREEEQMRDTIEHQDRRADQAYHDNEQVRNTIEHQERRADQAYHVNEQERNTVEHQERRADHPYHDNEQARNTIEHRERRVDPAYHDDEQSRNTVEHRERRVDPSYHDDEQARNTIEHRERRVDPAYHDNEQSRNTVEHQERRVDPSYRAEEQDRNTTEHQNRRADPEIRDNEQQWNTVRRSIRRRNILLRETERQQESVRRQRRRVAERQSNQDRNRIRNVRVRLHRSDGINRIMENQRQAERNRIARANNDTETTTTARRNTLRFTRYNDIIKNGPTIVCICCGGLWFPHQTEKINRNQINVSTEFLSQVFCLSAKFPSPNDDYSFCKTCSRAIKSKKKPNIRLSNGLDFPEIPECLKDLTSIEERLVTARLPFMVIISLGFERQSAIRGAVVNVPISVNQTVTSLPRTFDQAQVIQLHLRRRMEYQHDYMTETIRPAKVIEAARYLIATELYIKHGINIDDSWFQSFESQTVVPFVADRQDADVIRDIFNNQSTNAGTSGAVNQGSDEFCIENLNPGGQGTLLQNIPTENIPLQRVIMAPGEGQRPIDLIMDEDSEELSFASIYCGLKRSCAETYTKIIRSELRRYDRRACRIDKLLYSYKKQELLSIRNATSIALRKHTRSRNVTADNALNENYMNNLIQHDDGYRILKGIRSSPAHWEAEKKKVIAMIRQFGLPTFFITLSAAETKWTELLIILSRTVDSINISEQDASNLSFSEKARLIRSDSVTCARYFDFRFRQLFSLFKSDSGVFDKHFVEKYYWRVEFQQRGSPHIHGMYWLKDSPKVDLADQSTFPSVINFINKYISTDSADPTVSEYLPYQKHNHNRSCTREYKGEKICRYGMPYPPMSQTEILIPLPEDFENISHHKSAYDRIQSILTANLSNDIISDFNNFEHFLQSEHINLTYEEYKLALRSSLKKPKIYLRRKFEDKMVNAFNPTILALHRANMDIQFILDAYACCSYIINYINKSNRGVSRILRDAVDEIRGGNYSLKQKLQHIGHKFISGTEISAQEAVYCCLGMHLSESSNSDVYINTGRPEERVSILRSREQLTSLPPDSTDIFTTGLLDHYIQRPDELQELCLADFAAWYKYSRSARRSNNEESDNEHEEEDENEFSERTLALKDNSGYLKKKRKPHVIRYRRYNVNTHRSDYFRELVMLYHPWRDEQTELLETDNEATCTVHKDAIETIRKKYDVFEERELDNVFERLREDSENRTDNEENENHELDDEFRVLAIPEANANVNVLNMPADDTEGQDSGIRVIKLPPLIATSDLLSMVRSLNEKQKIYLTHILHNIKCGSVVYEFVGGGAGVGKSRLISAIYQSVNYRLNQVPGTDPNLLKVLLCAPTGKAAFGIGGATLHSMFSLPINQSAAEIRPLNPDTVNSLNAKLQHLRLLIIDEISMVGAKMFSHLDARLKQIFKTTTIFGGISVVVFGDLKQLSPVGDRWIFSPPSNDPYSVIYGASLWDHFKYFELTEIMRQRDDQTFAIALNNMASGQMSSEDIALIRTRIVSPATVPEEAIHLFGSNSEVDSFNTIKLNTIPTEEVISHAEDNVKSVGLSAENKNRILEAVKSFKTSETQGLPSTLLLKTTAKYMVTVNIDTSDGLVNGATGHLMQIDLNNNQKVSTLWIKFPQSSVGCSARTKKHHLQEALWTPLEAVVRSFQYKRSENINVDRRQFPVVPAEGITIHKSQGATYTCVAIHLKPRMNRSALYVACSRATQASGLFLIGNFTPPKPFSNNDAVQIEINNLRNSKKLESNFDCLLNTTTLRIVYHNVQSLHAHIDDVRNDKLMLKADILCFVETWTLSQEHYDIPGFTILQGMRLDSSGTNNRRGKRGIIVYVKNEIVDSIQFCDSKQVHVANKTFEFVTFKHNDIQFLVLYRNNSYPIGPLNIELNRIFSIDNNFSGKSVILGDFNICRRLGCSDTEKKFIDRGFTSLIETSTTKGTTKIDWCLTNIDTSTIAASTYETIYSYHDAICLSI